MSQENMKFENESDYGGFLLQDSNIDTGDILDSLPCSSLQEESWIETVHRGIIFVCYNLTGNKNDRLLIEINLLDKPMTGNSFDEWNNVVETSISITSDSLALTTLPDGERYPFGLFPMSNGDYRLRIYCRGIEKDPYEKSKEESIESYGNANDYPWDWGMEIKIYIWAGELLEQRTLHQTG
jgi:hypothetical protein